MPNAQVVADRFHVMTSYHFLAIAELLGLLKFNSWVIIRFIIDFIRHY